jgi:Protein of unknown function (DUF1353)
VERSEESLMIHLAFDPREPDVWVLDQDYVRDTSIGQITVPAGFETDLASSPWQMWSQFPKFGPWTGAAIVHDYLYRTKSDGVTRSDADRVFRELLFEDGVPHGQARRMYTAVRQFGDRAWNASDAIEEA